jgi:hypothetical protein
MGLYPDALCIAWLPARGLAWLILVCVAHDMRRCRDPRCSQFLQKAINQLQLNKVHRMPGKFGECRGQTLRAELAPPWSPTYDMCVAGGQRHPAYSRWGDHTVPRKQCALGRRENHLPNNWHL